MIRYILRGKLCVFYIAMLLIGFFIGYDYSTAASKHDDKQNINVSGYVDYEESTESGE